MGEMQQSDKEARASERICIKPGARTSFSQKTATAEGGARQYSQGSSKNAPLESRSFLAGGIKWKWDGGGIAVESGIWKLAPILSSPSHFACKWFCSFALSLIPPLRCFLPAAAVALCHREYTYSHSQGTFKTIILLDFPLLVWPSAGGQVLS